MRHRLLHRLLARSRPRFGVVAVATVLALTSATVAGTPPGEASASTPARFYVVGSDIIAPDGSKFVPVGGNVGVSMVSWSSNTYAFTSQGFTATGRAADAVAWGWNTIRVNVICNPGPSVTFAETLAGVQRVIDEYTAQRIVVMPACHDFTGADPSLDDGRWALIDRFWDEILARNGNNPYVWINYLNEPLTTGASDPRWALYGKMLYERVRSKGTENLFVWDFPSWGQGANELGAPASDVASRFVERRCNVVLSWHNYGASGTKAEMSEQARNLIAKRVAVLIGEFGYDWAGYRHNSVSYDVERRGGDWVFEQAPTFGFGALWWHATNTRADEIHSLREGGYGAWYSDEYPLSHGGQRLLQFGRNKPSFPRPVVDLAGSNCASAATGAVPLTTAAPSTITTTTTAAPEATGNLIQNASFEAADATNATNPAGWHESGWGVNTRTSSYPASGGRTGSRFGRVSVSAHASGDAKWAHAEVPVVGRATYGYAGWYRADVQTELVAQIRTGGNVLTYVWLGSVPATSAWTRTTAGFTTPADAVAVTVFHLIGRVGTLDIDDIELRAAAATDASTSTTVAPTTTVSPTTTTVAPTTTLAPTTTVSNGPGAFAKRSTGNGMKNRPSAPTLSWTASTGATRYEYCIDKTLNSTCDNGWISVAGALSAAVTGLISGAAYEWQVRAGDGSSVMTGANDGTWWRFTTR
jgi:hypothetical protein